MPKRERTDLDEGCELLLQPVGPRVITGPGSHAQQRKGAQGLLRCRINHRRASEAKVLTYC